MGGAVLGIGMSFFAGGLVPYGYVMASVDWTRSLDNSPEHMSQNQEFLANALMDQSNNNKSSPIYGMLSGKIATSGHSNGGAASTITTAELGSAKVQTMVTLSAAYCSECQQLAPSIKQPAMILTATNDCVCPPDTNAYPLYKALNSSCKYLINFINGTHCHFWEEKAPVEDWGCEEFLEHKCFMEHIPLHQQFGLTMKYSLPWMEYVLKGKNRTSVIDAMLNADVDSGVLIYEKYCPNP